MLKSILSKMIRATAATILAVTGMVVTSPQLVFAKIQSLNGRACWNAVYASIEMDNAKDGPPGVAYAYNGNRATLHVISSRPQPSGKDWHVIYEYYTYADPALPTGAVGQLIVDGSRAGSFKVSGDCPVLGRVAGVAYLDLNGNGKRDSGEPILPTAWIKVTGGGVWYVCGAVGSDATFGVTVNPGTYYVMPVAPRGYRTTTPRITVQVVDRGFIAGADMAFVKDPISPGDACDQYNPPRP